MAGALGVAAARASTKAFSRKSLRLSLTSSSSSSLRTYATVSAIPPKPHHRVVIVGGGTAGITVAAQLLRTKEFQKNEIAILDPAKDHHYQPGWTLVGSGLRPLSDMSRPLASLVPEDVTHYPLQVAQFDPENNELKTADGVAVSYEYLVVAPGLEVNVAGVQGLPEALQDPTSKVSSIYSHKTVEQVWQNVQDFKRGTAIFTQPAGVIKCAGAPQKILWMALSQWERDGVRKEILPYFATGAPAMFAVPKYSKALEALRVQRQVEGLFQHNLVGVDVKNKVATFKNLADNGKEVQKEFGFLHVTPPQKPWAWVAKSPLGECFLSRAASVIPRSPRKSSPLTHGKSQPTLLAGLMWTSPLPSTTSTRTSSPLVTPPPFPTPRPPPPFHPKRPCLSIICFPSSAARSSRPAIPATPPAPC